MLINRFTFYVSLLSTAKSISMSSLPCRPSNLPTRLIKRLKIPEMKKAHPATINGTM